MNIPENNHKLKNLADFYTKLLFTIAGLELALALVIITVGYYDIPSAIADAVKYSPYSHTELYFEQHNLLPRQINLNRIEVFQYTVHNLENRQYAYDYQVNLYLDNQTVKLDEGILTINPGEKVTKLVNFTITNPANKAQVVVLLKNKKQSIHFWLQNSVL